MKYLLLFLCLLAMPAHAIDPWSDADIKREVVFLTLNTVDYFQTREVAANPKKWEELNPLLGTHPSQSTVNKHFAAMMASQLLITTLLPEKYRLYWQYAGIGMEVVVVGHNVCLGIRLRF